MKRSDFFGAGHRVEKKDGPMEDSDGGQMGGTGGESFSEPTSKWHFGNCDNDEKVGGEDNQEATGLTEYGHDKNQHQDEISVRAGGRDDGRILTAKVIYD